MVLQFMWRKDFLLHKFYFLKTLQICVLRFWLVLLHSVFYFFFLYSSCSSPLLIVFDSISSNIDNVLFINLFANVFVFDINVHHKDWKAYSGGTNRPGEPWHNFKWPILRWLTFLLASLSVTLLMLVFVLQLFSFHWEILIMLVS